MAATDDQHEDLRWRIPCRDAAGEDREVSVLVMGDRIAVVLPPGDTLIFDADEADELSGLLARISERTEPT